MPNMVDVGRNVGVEGVNFGAGMGFLSVEGGLIRVGSPDDGPGVTPRRVGDAMLGVQYGGVGVRCSSHPRRA